MLKTKNIPIILSIHFQTTLIKHIWNADHKYSCSWKVYGGIKIMEITDSQTPSNTSWTRNNLIQLNLSTTVINQSGSLINENQNNHILTLQIKNAYWCKCIHEDDRLSVSRCVSDFREWEEKNTWENWSDQNGIVAKTLDPDHIVVGGVMVRFHQVCNVSFILDMKLKLFIRTFLGGSQPK